MTEQELMTLIPNYPFRDGKILTYNDVNNICGAFLNTSTESGGVQIVDKPFSIEYSELVELRDTSGLTPGMQYRLTNYECTVTNEYDSKEEEDGTITYIPYPYAMASNRGHFDIILVADDETTLNENVRFTHHEGDTYFVNSNLSAWEGKYSLDNDTNKFAWADPDPTNGKGVIYWLKDEYNNECPYDFKNIQFKRVENDVDNWYYTFTWVNNSGDIQDASVVGYNIGYDSDKYYGVHDNIIKSLSSVDVGIENRTCFSVYLNNIVFISNSTESSNFFGIFNNIFGINNHTFTFKYNCSCNTFGDDCYDFTFGNNCYYNVFKQYCHNNVFGDKCNGNTFGNSCGNNEFANYFQNNTIENSFVDNELTNDFIKNCMFDSNVSNITMDITTSNANYLQNINILSGTNNQTLNNLKTNQTYTQTCGFNSNNDLINENILDTNYPIITWTNNTATIKPNVYNIWNSGTYPTQLSLLTSNDTSVVNEYIIRFTIPSTVLDYSLIFNNELKWVDNNIPAWEAGCTYEISIIDGYAVFLKYF